MCAVLLVPRPRARGAGATARTTCRGRPRAGRYAEAAVESIRMAVRSPRTAGYWLSRFAASRVPWVTRRVGRGRRSPAGMRTTGSGPCTERRERSCRRAPPDRHAEHHPNGHHRRVSPALCLNGKVVDRRLNEAGRLDLAADLSAYRGMSCAASRSGRRSRSFLATSTAVPTIAN